MCLAGTRLLVEEAVAEEFLARFISRAAALKQGDPRDEATDVGPNITRQHLARIDGFVRRAVAAGARPLLGGAVNPVLGGLYYQPTLLAGAAPGSEILTEEVFGPVLTMQTSAAGSASSAPRCPPRRRTSTSRSPRWSATAARWSGRPTAGT